MTARIMIALLSVVSAGEEGPRLFFRPADVAMLRARIAEPGLYARGWAKIKSDANEMMDEPFVPRSEAESGKGQHGNYGKPSHQFQKLSQTVGFCQAVEPHDRYAEKLRGALLHYTQYQRWAGEAIATWDPGWNSELNTAHFTVGSALAYDVMRDRLSEPDRQTIIEAIVRLGIEPLLKDWLGPEERLHSLDSMGHNWWAVCVSAAGIGALAIERDLPEASAWADQVAEAFPEWFSYAGNLFQNKMRNFDRTGGFYEGPGYSAYAMMTFYMFRMAYQNGRAERADMLDDIPQLEGISDYILQTSYPTNDGMLTACFGDGAYNKPLHGLVTLSAAQDTSGDLAAAMQWYFNRVDQFPQTMYDMLLLKPDRPAKSPDFLPLTRLYPDMGWCMLRDSWADDATLLAIKCGDTWNHAHADAGSFLLWSQGEPIIIDSGSCPYSRPEYGQYFLRSEAHNVVLLDGKGQAHEDHLRASKFRGSIPIVLDGGAGTWRAVVADATGPTANLFTRNYRTFLWAGDVIVILDELRSHDEGHMEWLLHTNGKAITQVEQQQIVVETKTTGATIQTVWPEDVTYETRSGFLREIEAKDPARPVKQIDYLAAIAPHTSREGKFITTIIPGRRKAKASHPVFRRLAGPHHIGTSWEVNDTVTEVYLNLRADGRRMHRNANATIGPWHTDAYLMVLERPANSDPNDPDSITRFLVLGGSYLRTDEAIVLDSLAQVHAIWEPQSTSLTIKGGNVHRVRLRSKQMPKQIRVNGNMTPATCDDNTRHLISVAHWESGPW